MRLIRFAARRTPAAAFVPLVLATMAGCGGGGSGTPSGSSSPAVPIGPIGARIEEELSGRADVVSAEVSYRDNISNPGSAVVDITMQPGADVEGLYEEGLRLIWESEMNPLTVIYVNVINPEDPPSGLSRSIYLNQGDERAVLEQKYGPHPD